MSDSTVTELPTGDAPEVDRLPAAAAVPAAPARRRRRDRRGMTTAEYAVGTVAAVTFAGVLITIFQNPQFRDLIFDLIVWIIKLITGFQG